jgi:membrane protein
MKHLPARCLAELAQLPGRTLRLAHLLRESVTLAIGHDAVNLSQSASYSALVSLFPALVVAAAIIGLLPDAAPVKASLGAFFDEVLPGSAYTLLTGYFAAPATHTVGSLVLAGFVSMTGGTSVLATLMEGVRRAHRVPTRNWTWLQQRRQAFALAFLSLLPLALATVIVMFGRFAIVWLASSLWSDARPLFLTVALVVRWVVALSGVVALTASIYHQSLPRRLPWLKLLPGAVCATVLWFISTLAFGWYVTRFANYSQIYGSLGVGIALLFWLQLVFLSVLCGAEFNEQLFRLSAAIFQQGRSETAISTSQH